MGVLKIHPLHGGLFGEKSYALTAVETAYQNRPDGRIVLKWIGCAQHRLEHHRLRF
jgi:hypothetical protein